MAPYVGATITLSLQLAGRLCHVSAKLPGSGVPYAVMAGGAHLTI